VLEHVDDIRDLETRIEHNIGLSKKNKEPPIKGAAVDFGAVYICTMKRWAKIAGVCGVVRMPTEM